MGLVVSHQVRDDLCQQPGSLGSCSIRAERVVSDHGGCPSPEQMGRSTQRTDRTCSLAPAGSQHQAEAAPAPGPGLPGGCSPCPPAKSSCFGHWPPGSWLLATTLCPLFPRQRAQAGSLLGWARREAELRPRVQEPGWNLGTQERGELAQAATGGPGQLPSSGTQQLWDLGQGSHLLSCDAHAWKQGCSPLMGNE